MGRERVRGRGRGGTAKKAGAAGGLSLAAGVFSIVVRLARSYGGDDPPELVDPADIVAAPDLGGGFIVADPGAHQVLWLHDGELVVVAGTGTGADAVADADGDAPPSRKPAGDATRIDLGAPAALAEADGKVFVADPELGAVVRLHGEQQLDTLPGLAASPQAVAVAGNSPLYAVLAPPGDGDDDGHGDQVVAWSRRDRPPEPVTALDGITAAGGGRAIRGLGVGAGGTLYIWIDSAGLYAVGATGTPTPGTPATESAVRLVDATGDERYDVVDLAVAATGDIAVAEPDAERITVFRPDGGVRRRIDLPFPPTAVTFDTGGSLVVLRGDDPEGVFVYRVGPDGEVEGLGPGAAKSRAGDRLSSATTTTR